MKTTTRIALLSLALILALSPVAFAGNNDDCVAPPNAKLDRYPVQQTQEMTPETAASMGLELHILTEPWEGFNWYGGNRRCYQYERLPAGTRVYVDSGRQPRYKADCSNRLVGIKECPTCTAIVASQTTPTPVPLTVRVGGRHNDVNVVVGNDNTVDVSSSSDSGRFSSPDPYFGNKEGGRGESNLGAMFLGFTPLVGAGCGLFALPLVFLFVLGMIIWGIRRFLRRNRANNQTTTPPTVASTTGGGTTTPPPPAPPADGGQGPTPTNDEQAAPTTAS